MIINSVWKAVFLPLRLEMHFMPIVQFSHTETSLSWKTIGYEALLRGPRTSALEAPVALFGLARTLGLSKELELWCIQRTLSHLPDLPIHARVFVNVSPETYVSEEFFELLHDSTLPRPRDRIVFELLEGKIRCFDRLRDAISYLSCLGFATAVDDIGAVGSGLNRMQDLCPVDYLKIDRYFLPDTWKTNRKKARAWLAPICEAASAAGARIILEGVEAQHRGLLKEIEQEGITLGQGYLFGRPDRILRKPSILPLCREASPLTPSMAGI